MNKARNGEEINPFAMVATVFSIGDPSIKEQGIARGWQTSNWKKIGGYIPLVGTILGAMRIYEAATASKDELSNKVNHILRGCVELLSLGLLFFIPDLIVTLARKCKSENAESLYRESLFNPECDTI